MLALAHRLVPLQRDLEEALSGTVGDGLDRVAAPPKSWCSLGGREHERALLALAGAVAGRGEVGDAVGPRVVDRLGDHAVLEERLVEVEDVVGDDVRRRRT